MTRNEKIQQIYKRLGSLEEQRETARIADKDVSEIDAEMKALRITLQETMNSVDCPLVTGVRQ